RDKIVPSAIFIGLAASTIQLSWFALPFLYILILREHGGKVLLKSIAISGVTFLLVNLYFIILSPFSTIGNIFALFGLTKLPFYGANIMQFFVAFYPVPYWYSVFVSVTVL